MAESKLKTLVLGGVTILVDGVAVNLRRGTSTAKEAPENPISMRHPLADVQAYPPPGGRFQRANEDSPEAADRGTGRFPWRAGVLGGSARSAGQAILSGWSSSKGGFPLLAVMCVDPLAICRSASGSEKASRQVQAPRPEAGRSGIASLTVQAPRCLNTNDWLLPASHTPPVSTRGK